jgi:hypothetical protein
MLEIIWKTWYMSLPLPDERRQNWGVVFAANQSSLSVMDGDLAAHHIKFETRNAGRTVMLNTLSIASPQAVQAALTRQCYCKIATML